MKFLNNGIQETKSELHTLVKSTRQDKEGYNPKINPA